MDPLGMGGGFRLPQHLGWMTKNVKRREGKIAPGKKGGYYWRRWREDKG